MGQGGGDDRAIGGGSLVVRGLALRGVELAYHAGVFCGSAALFLLGGFVPVLRGWLGDAIDDWGGVVEALGGVRSSPSRAGKGSDLGLPVTRSDAATLLGVVQQVSRKLGTPPPDQIRLAYVPCCGVVERGRTSILLLGMPLLHVLTACELRAVLAHELAHLARGDATRSARAARFVDALTRGLDETPGAWGPLRLWAALCRDRAAVLAGPITFGQEARADRLAAVLAGGPTAASALVKVAMVQPLFQEVLDHYDAGGAELNLYAFFRKFWGRLPASLLTAMRHRLLTQESAVDDSAHPPLLDRLARLQGYPDQAPNAAGLPILDPDTAPAAALLGDPEAVEQALHDRLFRKGGIARSVFHRSGT